MKRTFDIAVVAVATLGVVAVGLAGCCHPDEGACAHERTVETPHVASHCAPPPAPSALSLEATCCGDPGADSPDYGLQKPLPLPGPLETRETAPSIAAPSGSAPHLALGIFRAPSQRSPILRL